MNILVTGGCGFIGSAVCRHLIRSRVGKVVNLDALTYAADLRSIASIEDDEAFCFVEGNINDSELVDKTLKDHEIDAVMHLAAESHVDRSIDGPGIFLETNILGTYSLLQATRKYLAANPHKKKRFRFHHISTDEVYGDLTEDDPAFTELTAYKPSSPYSASKAASDHLVAAWGRTFDIPYLITNCSNNYGPYQFPEKLIPLMIISAISGKKLPVYGDGRNIRDWLHVEDHAEGLALVLAKGKIGETYNLGGNSELRNIEIVEMICHTLDELVPKNDGSSYADQISFVSDRPGHDHRYAVSCDKISRDLGWQPAHSFETGLRETIIWYLDNRDWWQSLMDRSAA